MRISPARSLVLLLAALVVFNGQCVAACMILPCVSERPPAETKLPPCHNENLPSKDTGHANPCSLAISAAEMEKPAMEKPALAADTLALPPDLPQTLSHGLADPISAQSASELSPPPLAVLDRTHALRI